MPTKKQTGNRCEHLVAARLLKPGPRPNDLPLFNPALLVGDWPTLDIYVELEGTFRRMKPFFFIQVKGTIRGLNYANDLQVQLSSKHTRRLLNMPAPTYLVGVDSLTEEMFIQSIHDPAVRLVSALRTTFPLNYAIMHMIHQEVAAFWQAHGSKPQASKVQV